MEEYSEIVSDDAAVVVCVSCGMAFLFVVRSMVLVLPVFLVFRGCAYSTEVCIPYYDATLRASTTVADCDKRNGFVNTQHGILCLTFELRGHCPIFGFIFGTSSCVRRPPSPFLVHTHSHCGTRRVRVKGEDCRTPAGDRVTYVRTETEQGA